ncbi:hypothetical protein QFC19_003364 [Naganishia cerealis]|uniref:Uncharacterized protein n=1 Tax=Naganishia cerealis TaxID=610337 RepID=A0ACC2W5A3_9TREE|nr:hypothetical protein QFC19_003364 [Naganishia cerealis]
MPATYLLLSQIYQYNPVLSQFYPRPEKGQTQSDPGRRGPGETLLSFSVALWVVAYFYPYIGLYISKVYAMCLLVACTYLAVLRKTERESKTKPSGKEPPTTLPRGVQHFLRIHVIYVFLSLIDRFYDLGNNISCIWPYWVVVISTFAAGGHNEPVAMLPFTWAVRFLALAGSVFIPSILPGNEDAIHQPEQYHHGFVRSVRAFARVLPEVYEVLEWVAFDLQTPVIWIVSDPRSEFSYEASGSKVRPTPPVARLQFSFAEWGTSCK